MTEAKSPREIAEQLLQNVSLVEGFTGMQSQSPIQISTSVTFKRRSDLISEIEQALLSYAAERERLLVSLDELIVRRLHRLSGSGPQFEHDCALINGVHLRQTVRRARPATEGKREDE